MKVKEIEIKEVRLKKPYHYKFRHKLFRLNKKSYHGFYIEKIRLIKGGKDSFFLVDAGPKRIHISNLE